MTLLADFDFESVFKIAFGLIVFVGWIFGALIQNVTKKKRESETLERLRRSREARKEGAAGEAERAESPRPAFMEVEETDAYGRPIDRPERPQSVKTVKTTRPVGDTVIVQETPVRPADPGPEIVIREVIGESPDERHLERLHSKFESGGSLTKRHFEHLHSHFEADERKITEAGREAGSARDFPLEERVFKGRKVHPIIQAVVYTEIFGPPRSRSRTA